MITTFLSILISGMAFGCMATLLLLKRSEKDPAKKLSFIAKEASALALSMPPHKTGLPVFSQEFSKNKFIPEDIQKKYETMLREVMPKSDIVKGQITSFSKKIETNTETAIINFSQLLQSLGASINATTNVVESLRTKMSLCIQREGETVKEKDLKGIQDRYQNMLNEVMEQLSMTINRKSEDIARLDHIKESVNQIKPVSNEISKLASSTKIVALNAAIEAARAGSNGKCFAVVADEVRRLAENSNQSSIKIETDVAGIISYIETATADLKQAMDVESRFINATVILLQDIVLSVVDSFVRLSEAIEKTLGESSTFRNEVNSIIFNLQFEDICKQMSEHTVEIVTAIQNDLKNFRISDSPKARGKDPDNTHGILANCDALFTMSEERDIARRSLEKQNSASIYNKGSAKDPEASEVSPDEDVTFF